MHTHVIKYNIINFSIQICDTLFCLFRFLFILFAFTGIQAGSIPINGEGNPLQTFHTNGIEKDALVDWETPTGKKEEGKITFRERKREAMAKYLKCAGFFCDNTMTSTSHSS
jgi:hypothetical protein